MAGIEVLGVLLDSTLLLVSCDVFEGELLITKGAEVDCQSSVSVDVAVIENCERTGSDI